MNRPSSIPTAPSRRGFLAVLSAGAASAVAPAALAAPLAPVTETALSGLPPAAAASSEVDPIFALIAEHSAAYAEMAAISGAADLKGRDRDEASEAAMGHSDEVLLHLLTTPPVTLAGVAAILQHLARREWDDPENYNILCGAVQGSAALADAADGFFGNLAATVRAMAGITTIRRIEPSEPDPIYAAIKAEREAYAAYLATGEVQSRISDQDPDPDRDPIAVKPSAVPRKRRKTAAVKAWWAEYQKADAVHSRATQKWLGTRVAFLQTLPTTVTGLRAFVVHIDGPFSHGDAGEAYWDEHEMEMACPTLIAAVRSVIDGGVS